MWNPSKQKRGKLRWERRWSITFMKPGGASGRSSALVGRGTNHVTSSADLREENHNGGGGGVQGAGKEHWSLPIFRQVLLLLVESGDVTCQQKEGSCRPAPGNSSEMGNKRSYKKGARSTVKRTCRGLICPLANSIHLTPIRLYHLQKGRKELPHS